MEALDKVRLMNCLGDSITQGVGNGDISWVDYLREWMPDWRINKYGVAGAIITNCRDKDDSFVQRFLAMETGADAVVIFGGVNDFNHGIPLGSRTEDGEHPFSEDLGTFYGAFSYLCREVWRRNPTGTVLVVTPIRSRDFKDYPHWNTKNQAGFKLIDYRNAMLEVCRHYNIPVLDLFSCGGMTPDIPEVRAAWMPDGLHPNERGYRKLTRKIYHFIESSI